MKRYKTRKRLPLGGLFLIQQRVATKKMKTIALIGTFSGALPYLFGVGTQELYLILAVMMGVDIFTGLLNAGKQKKIWSAKMTTGLFKKFGFIGLFIASNMADKYLEISGMGFPPVVGKAAIGIVFAIEFISISENLLFLGVPLPKPYITLLKAFKDMTVQKEEAREQVREELKIIQESAAAVEQVIKKVEKEEKLEEAIKKQENNK